MSFLWQEELHEAEGRYQQLLKNTAMQSDGKSSMASTRPRRSSTGQRNVFIQLAGAQYTGKTSLLEALIQEYEPSALQKFNEQKSNFMAHHQLQVQSSRIAGPDERRPRGTKLAPLWALSVSRVRIEFTWRGFWAAMMSNVVSSARTVLTKMAMDRHVLDPLNFQALLQCAAFIVSIPVALLFNLHAVREIAQDTAALPSILLIGPLVWTFNVASIVILVHTTTVVHSMIRSMRRPLLVLASIITFGTSITHLNALGIMFTLFGAFWYCKVAVARELPEFIKEVPEVLTAVLMKEGKGRATCTAACASDRWFYCYNKGGTARYIYASRVGDGICDCCDGSDEWQRPGVCRDVCAEQGQARKARLEKRRSEMQRGIEMRTAALSSMQAEAKVSQDEVLRLEAEKEPLLKNLKHLEELQRQARAAAQQEAGDLESTRLREENLVASCCWSFFVIQGW
eukprot:g2437.t1